MYRQMVFRSLPYLHSQSPTYECVCVTSKSYYVWCNYRRAIGISWLRSLPCSGTDIRRCPGSTPDKPVFFRSYKSHILAGSAGIAYVPAFPMTFFRPFSQILALHQQFFFSTIYGHINSGWKGLVLFFVSLQSAQSLRGRLAFSRKFLKPRN